MEQLVIIVHVLCAVMLIGLVLIQRGKGSSMGSSFGGGASQTVFGSRGSIGFLVKLTISIAALFFATSIALTYIATRAAHSRHAQDLLGRIEQIAEKTAPASAPKTMIKKTPRVIKQHTLPAKKHHR